MTGKKDKPVADAIKDLVGSAATAIRGKKPAAEPDLFDPERMPYGVGAGRNKFGWESCPFCGKPGTLTQLAQEPVFLFRNELSAREYGISGLCQACQDSTFTHTEDFGEQ
jgi:hypothetical protein